MGKHQDIIDLRNYVWIAEEKLWVEKRNPEEDDEVVKQRFLSRLPESKKRFNEKVKNASNIIDALEINEEKII